MSTARYTASIEAICQGAPGHDHRAKLVWEVELDESVVHRVSLRSQAAEKFIERGHSFHDVTLVRLPESLQK